MALSPLGSSGATSVATPDPLPSRQPRIAPGPPLDPVGGVAPDDPRQLGAPVLLPPVGNNEAIMAALAGIISTSENANSAIQALARALQAMLGAPLAGNFPGSQAGGSQGTQAGATPRPSSGGSPPASTPPPTAPPTSPLASPDSPAGSGSQPLPTNTPPTPPGSTGPGGTSGPPPVQPPRPIPQAGTDATVADFGRMTVNGASIYLGQLQAPYVTRLQAAQYVAAVINTQGTSPVTASVDEETGLLKLASRTGSPITISKVGDFTFQNPENRIDVGFRTGMFGTTVEADVPIDGP